ncbi:biopolymer transport protein ExbD [bacterium BMS3Abin07]|nr:biopolymer transport protein ExbD [bacterium BMS3Abin07]HDL20705.1 biopolymer transporter ExbD [Nitrospirota bacterium]HDY72518.1 biopolymer transporter ExbD [Nitrospirota bacterium]
MEFERRRYNHSYMNIAPLVDVVFLLLLFFMLTSRLIREPTLKVRLPESKTAATEQETIRTITITRGGRIFFMDREIRLKGLQRAVRESLTIGEKGSLRIKADRDADVGLLVNVIDEVRLAGIKDFSIVTEKAE